mgnify:FL=1
MGREPGRNLFYRAGKSVFLLFKAEETLKGNSLPPHGASGPVHTCFEWPLGPSFYFHDPDGNLLEIANNDLWPA